MSEDIVSRFEERIAVPLSIHRPVVEERDALRAEVERLRAALEKIAKPEPYLWKAEYFIGTARAALEESKK